MNKPVETPFDSRLEALARSVGEEHALHLGMAIGNVLSIAWEGLASLATLLARPFTGKPRDGARGPAPGTRQSPPGAQA